MQQGGLNRRRAEGATRGLEEGGGGRFDTPRFCLSCIVGAPNRLIHIKTIVSSATVSPVTTWTLETSAGLIS